MTIINAAVPVGGRENVSTSTLMCFASPALDFSVWWKEPLSPWWTHFIWRGAEDSDTTSCWNRTVWETYMHRGLQLDINILSNRWSTCQVRVKRFVQSLLDVHQRAWVNPVMPFLANQTFTVSYVLSQFARNPKPGGTDNSTLIYIQPNGRMLVKY